MSNSFSVGTDKTKTYTITVDKNKCIGAASCVGISPKTFRLDEKNKAVVINEGGDSLDNVLMAAQSCPTKAITVIDRDGRQIWPK